MPLTSDQITAIVDAIASRADTTGDAAAKIGLGDPAGDPVEYIFQGVSFGTYNRGQAILPTTLLRELVAGVGDFILDSFIKKSFIQAHRTTTLNIGSYTSYTSVPFESAVLSYGASLDGNDIVLTRAGLYIVTFQGRLYWPPTMTQRIVTGRVLYNSTPIVDSETEAVFTSGGLVGQRYPLTQPGVLVQAAANSRLTWQLQLNAASPTLNLTSAFMSVLEVSP